MTRKPGTATTGDPFDREMVTAVWEKGSIIDGYPESDWRRDRCGRVIKRTAYGDASSPHGWEIDHFKPVARGGGDELVNLQPLHWKVNREKGDKYPWMCPPTVTT